MKLPVALGGVVVFLALSALQSQEHRRADSVQDIVLQFASWIQEKEPANGKLTVRAKGKNYDPATRLVDMLKDRQFEVKLDPKNPPKTAENETLKIEVVGKNGTYPLSITKEGEGSQLSLLCRLPGEKKRDIVSTVEVATHLGLPLLSTRKKAEPIITLNNNRSNQLEKDQRTIRHGDFLMQIVPKGNGPLKFIDLAETEKSDYPIFACPEIVPKMVLVFAFENQYDFDLAVQLRLDGRLSTEDAVGYEEVRYIIRAKRKGEIASWLGPPLLDAPKGKEAQFNSREIRVGEVMSTDPILNQLDPNRVSTIQISWCIAWPVGATKPEQLKDFLSEKPLLEKGKQFVEKAEITEYEYAPQPLGSITIRYGKAFRQGKK
jgi:hypothetical protein